MAEAIPLIRNGGFLRRRTTHGGWRSSGARRSSNLLRFWSYLHGEIFWKRLKKLEALWVLRKLKIFKSSDAGLIEREEQSSELTVGLDAYLELDLSQTRVQRGTRIRIRKHPTRYSRLKLRVASQHQLRSHLNNNQESRLKVASQHQLRVVSLQQLRITSQLYWSSRLHGDRVYEGRILSHIWSICLLLQSVQQSTSKSNWQFYRFNSILTNKPESYKC